MSVGTVYVCVCVCARVSMCVTMRYKLVVLKLWAGAHWWAVRILHVGPQVIGKTLQLGLYWQPEI